MRAAAWRRHGRQLLGGGHGAAEAALTAAQACSSAPSGGLVEATAVGSPELAALSVHHARHRAEQASQAVGGQVRPSKQDELVGGHPRLDPQPCSPPPLLGVTVARRYASGAVALNKVLSVCARVLAPRQPQ